MVLQMTSLAPEMLNRCATPRALPTRKFSVEPDAPIEVKSWFELFGPRSVWTEKTSRAT